MAIHVEQITKKYGRQKALDAVSLDIQSGEIAGLLGPNGAGKSTMMKILSCFLPPSSGTASVCGFDVQDESMQVRRKVGYLPENNPLYLDMYVKEYLSFVAGIYKIRNRSAKVDEMIGVTGISSEQHKRIGALSKGYRQRVGLAQAMIHDPEVLILDEPTSGLDPNQIMEIRKLIKTLGKEKTVILSTHIMQEVEAMCDRAIIINKGVIVADDKTSALSRMFTGKNLVQAEFDKKVEEKILLGIAGVKAVKRLGDMNWEIEAATDEDIRPVIFRFAIDNGLTVLSMQKKEEASIQEVFQRLTQE